MITKTTQICSKIKKKNPHIVRVSSTVKVIRFNWILIWDRSSDRYSKCFKRNPLKKENPVILEIPSNSVRLNLLHTWK